MLKKVKKKESDILRIALRHIRGERKKTWDSHDAINWEEQWNRCWSQNGWVI